MARITVEDCLEQVPNRFSLVLVSAERAKQLLRGAPSLIGESENKEIVTSLREVAAGHFVIDDSAVLAHDQWVPEERRTSVPGEILDEELPPEI